MKSPRASFFSACLAVVISALALVSCGRQAAVVAPSSAPAPDTNRQVFQVRGVIKRIASAEQRAVIAHEEITNYMAAMTMPFHVRDTNELTGLKPGDAVLFQYVVLPDDDWIENIRRTEARPGPNLATNHVAVAPYVELLKVGETFPPGTFTNQTGQVLSLAGLRGQAFALGFFYTRCPLTDVCPRQSAGLAETAQRLATNSAAPSNWRLLCVTLDPERDTPPTLDTFAGSVSRADGHWEFLTGDAAALNQLASRCGVVTLPDPNSIRHNLRVVVVNTAGRVQNIFKGGHWTADELAAALVTAAVIARD